MSFRYVAPSTIANVLSGVADDLDVFGDDVGIRSLVIERIRRFVREEISTEHPPPTFERSLSSPPATDNLSHAE